MKVFITGLGSDLGTNIARLLEQKSEVTELAGIDMYPPRRYLARTKFFMTHYDDSERIAHVIKHFSPDVIIHFGVYEPGARLGEMRGKAATHASVSGVIHAAQQIMNEHDVRVITRSSVVAYGFREPERAKDETTPLSPDTFFGKMCRDVEEELLSHLTNVTIIRTAPEISAHVPHPLARLLKLPAIPIQARLPFAHDIGFPIIASRDVTELFVRAAMAAPDYIARHRVLHGATSSNATMSMAAQEGKRIPIFVTGMNMGIIKRMAYLAGAPITEHVEMFIRRGMIIDSTSTRMHLGITSQDSPSEILRHLYHPTENMFAQVAIPEMEK